MSIQVTKTPVRYLNDNPALPSKWSAVHHPITFEMRRQDLPVIQVQLIGGVQRVLLPSIPSDLQIGQTIRLVSGPTNADVLVTGISGNQISVTGSVSPFSTGGFINLTEARKNYLVETRIMAVNESNQYYQVGLVESKPAPDGNFKLPVSGFLKNIAEMSDSFLYNVLNKKIVGAGSRFNIQYREVWFGHEGSFSILSSTNVFYWTNATKQLQERYNFNVAEHVLFPTIDTAKFMSDFDSPTYFPGFPFSLSFIYSDAVNNRQIAKEEEGFDLNGGTIYMTEYDLDASGSLAVNRLMIEPPPDDAAFVDVWLEDTGPRETGYVNPGFFVPGYTKVSSGLPQIKQR